MSSSPTPALFALPGEAPHEQVTLATDAGSGLRTVIAIHSTARGPAFGGCRLWDYADDTAAVTDALRLSLGMSLKNALADLPFGGGKAVILKPRTTFDRQALYAAFGQVVDRLGGRYITAEDVGSTTADMRCVQSRTPHVSGIPREDGFGGDPSPMTARGVFVAIEQALRLHLRRPVAGATVAVQGLGAVGSGLCALLHAAGARLIVADIDPGRVDAAVARFGARAVPVADVLAEPADVLAPCALGAVLDADSVPRVRAAVVAGAANNQLARLEDGDALHAAGVLYLPDFLINAGGIVSVAREHLGTGSAEAVATEVDRIGLRVAQLMEQLEGRPPVRVAEAWARRKLAAG